MQSAPYRRVIALLGGAVLCGASTDGRDPGPQTLTLFVASWCAPCRAELARLDEITRAAAPRKVRVIAIDDRAATVRMLAGVPSGQRLSMSPKVASGLMRRLAGNAPGLPLSVMTDTAGRPCAVHRRPLTADEVATMTLRCRSADRD
jgi:hypothetical protein